MATKPPVVAASDDATLLVEPAPVAAASVTETASDNAEPFVAEPGFGHAEEVVADVELDPALIAQDGSYAPRDPEVEAIATTTATQLAAKLIPMSHPDGGTSDAFSTNKAGNILVPAADAAAMFSLGFAVVDGG